VLSSKNSRVRKVFVIPNLKFVGFLVRLLEDMLHNFLFHFSLFFHKTKFKLEKKIFRSHLESMIFWFVFLFEQKKLFDFLFFGDDSMRL
jgi:hypothetical protein